MLTFTVYIAYLPLNHSFDMRGFIFMMKISEAHRIRISHLLDGIDPSVANIFCF